MRHVRTWGFVTVIILTLWALYYQGYIPQYSLELLLPRIEPLVVQPVAQPLHWQLSRPNYFSLILTAFKTVMQLMYKSHLPLLMFLHCKTLIFAGAARCYQTPVGSLGQLAGLF
jgi:hypothetical protein